MNNSEPFVIMTRKQYDEFKKGYFHYLKRNETSRLTMQRKAEAAKLEKIENHKKGILTKQEVKWILEHTS